MLSRSPSAHTRYVSPGTPRVSTAHTALEWSSAWEVVSSIQPEHFQKSDELEAIPGQWADTYRYIKTGDEELDGEDGWYVKAFIDDSQALRLSIMSANWEG